MQLRICLLTRARRSLTRAPALRALPQKFQDDTAALPQQSGVTSAAYTLLTLNFFAAGLAYLYAPETTLDVRARSLNLQCLSEAASLFSCRCA